MITEYCILAFLAINLSCHTLLAQATTRIPSVAGKDQPTICNSQPEETTNANVLQSFSRLPLYFIENQGQINTQALYYTKKGNQSVYFTKERMVFVFLRKQILEDKNQYAIFRKHEGISKDITVAPEKREKKGNLLKGNANRSLERLVFSLSFENSNKDLLVKGEVKQKGRVNYFTGNDKRKWRTNIPTYKGVVYQDIYKGIDLRVFGNGNALEYEFKINPGANPENILLSYEGINGLRTNEHGELIVETAFGELKESRPYLYQVINGEKVKVEGEFKIKKGSHQPFGQLSSGNNQSTVSKGQQSYGFQIDLYNSDYPLIIDPTLLYSTYLGSNDEDGSGGIVVDDIGNVYVTGGAGSDDFPTVNAIHDRHSGGFDVFITKLNPSGDTFLFSTFLGGNADDGGFGLALDDANNVYIIGDSESSDFPTVNAIQDRHRGGFRDAIILKLNSSGDTLLFSTFLGGTEDDSGNAIAVDDINNVYVTGFSKSIDFPTINAIQDRHRGGFDIFMTKLNSSGDTLLFSTFLGGTEDDFGIGIAVDDINNVYVAGASESSDFPTVNAIQDSYNGFKDAIVLKLNSSGDTLLFSTYLGGRRPDQASAIDVDDINNVYVTGFSDSFDFPTTENAIQGSLDAKPDTIPIDPDAFITKLNPSGDTLLFSTYLGGSFWDVGNAIAVDDTKNVYITGISESFDFPTTANATQVSINGPRKTLDAFITKLNSSGDTLLFSTFLGGTDNDGGWGITVDDMKNVYVIGDTRSNNFPILNPIDDTSNGFWDVFVAKISLDDITTPTPTPTVILLPTPTITLPPESTPTPTPSPQPSPSGTIKSFIFNCEHGLERRYVFGLEKLTMNVGETENCMLKLTKYEPGTVVEISSLLRKGFRSAVSIEPVRSVTNANGELSITITAIKKGKDWAAWAVPNGKGQFTFTKQSYDAGLAWGMFVDVR